MITEKQFHRTLELAILRYLHDQIGKDIAATEADPDRISGVRLVRLRHGFGSMEATVAAEVSVYPRGGWAPIEIAVADMPMSRLKLKTP